jgi:amphi-Trp domain-containing protein
MDMSDFKHKEQEQLSRQQAAERLVDIAYALTTGGPLELTAAGRRITVPVAGELRLERELKSEGDQVQLELELTWSAANGSRSD